MIRKVDICDIHLRSHFVSEDNSPSKYAMTCSIFQPCYLYYIIYLSAHTKVGVGTAGFAIFNRNIIKFSYRYILYNIIYHNLYYQ